MLLTCLYHLLTNRCNHFSCQEPCQAHCHVTIIHTQTSTTAVDHSTSLQCQWLVQATVMRSVLHGTMQQHRPRGRLTCTVDQIFGISWQVCGCCESMHGRPASLSIGQGTVMQAHEQFCNKAPPANHQKTLNRPHDAPQAGCC